MTDQINQDQAVGPVDVEQENNSRPTIMISANAFWNLVNFREALVRELVTRGYQVLLVAPKADEEWAAQRGARAMSVNIDRSGLNPIKDANLVVEYLRLIKEYRPVFYFGFTVKPNVYGSIAATLYGVRALPNVSGLGTAFISPGPLAWLVGCMYRFAFRKCPIVFFQNPDDRDLFLRRRIVTASQARILPGSGVDLQRFMPPAKDAEGLNFLFIGRLLGDKGVREFVEAARIVRSRHPSWRFQVLGQIDEDNRTAIKRAELDQWIEEANIQYLGTTKDVRPFLAEASAVVLPSYREGLPRTLLEAAAMGRPLLATDVPGNREIVQDGMNGFLCRSRDPKALAELMLKFGQLPLSERQMMGRASRKLVEEFYSEDRVISSYLEAMAQLRPVAGV